MGLPIAPHISDKYADLLRVGELWINGEPTRWRTKGYGKEAWFDNFELAFRARLRQLERSGLVPPCDLASEITLVYWVCKLTSINYCLWEICSYIQQSLEKSRMVILETFDSSNPTLSILEYSLTLVGAATGTICMRWTKDNNIMYVNRHGQRRCKGTMKTIETQVPLRLLSDPEVENFRPIYDVDMELIVPRSIGDRIVGRLSCFNRGLDRFTDSSSLVSAVEPLMPRGSSNLRQISYPPAAPLFAEGEETSAGRRRSSRHGHAYTAEAQQLSTTNDNEIDAEIRSRRRASAQHRLDELSQYRRYIRTSSGYLVEEALPFNSRESSRSPVNSGRRSAGSDDSFLGPQTPRDRYARTGSQQSIPGEFDDPGGGRGDTFRNHSRNRESVSKHKIKTPDTGSTVTSKKSVAFAPDERNAEEQRVEAQRRLAQLQQYRRYIGNQPAESSNPEMFDEPPSRIPPSW
ncbi:hypothetical protein Pmar_PMAR018364 [Perkinsus marinus ATCC 50983]|uniref:Uncharacterized protein n=1 Tax=Perkinsus marinus (strain ATCC 50983 / TXsc) TaxID=423536 RepID=C5LS09_PERM5|nr:hypothetical protein Pmar_PMAR018364 [Perkinsus marinus ATCC 50983]EER00481.1 hypothetical protein Pmar_PMAR018364 [Perkinsus marinus ATCC 50983]|eukprot:XP_002767763.1 hypothetical protein Pmar_PMAR018364 [Perkinsus marinus ATCC 50983]